jgi:hypothetical protein
MISVRLERRAFAKVVGAQLTIYKDTAGKVTHIVLHQNGDHEAKRLRF